MEEFINQIEPLYGREEIAAVEKYLQSGGWLTEFKKTREFEKRFARFVKTKYCSMLPNGTLSLFVALKSLGIEQGDEVLVPDLTMAATPNAVLLTGAKVVFCDIEEQSLCLDVEKAARAINKKTKAVLHVSLNGRAGELQKLKQLCQKKKIHLIEDAAQSSGSFYRRKHLGTFGVIGSFSFSMPKIITMGQGGCLITDDSNLFNKIKLIRDFGRPRSGKDFYQTVGWNFKFSDLQAVFGLEQFKKLKKRMRKKKEIFSTYQRLLSGVEEVKFIETNLKETTPWFCDILVTNPKKLMNYLEKQGIGSRLIYPALHGQPAYKNNPLVRSPGDYPISQKIAEKGLWLPSSLCLTKSQIKYICQKIKRYYES